MQKDKIQRCVYGHGYEYRGRAYFLEEEEVPRLWKRTTDLEERSKGIINLI